MEEKSALRNCFFSCTFSRRIRIIYNYVCSYGFSKRNARAYNYFFAYFFSSQGNARAYNYFFASNRGFARKSLVGGAPEYPVSSHSAAAPARGRTARIIAARRRRITAAQPRQQSLCVSLLLALAGSLLCSEAESAGRRWARSAVGHPDHGERPTGCPAVDIQLGSCKLGYFSPIPT